MCEYVPSRHSFEKADGCDLPLSNYLLYGRIYIPTGRVDALYSTRLSPGVQAMVAAISDPRSNPLSAERSINIPTSNIMLSLKYDTGKTCTEYTWNAEDGMFGARLLHNFGKLAPSSEEAAKAQHSVSIESHRKRVGEEEAVEGGLKERISAGVEVYFSARKRSAGVSSGLCFTTGGHATFISTPVRSIFYSIFLTPLYPITTPNIHHSLIQSDAWTYIGCLCG